MKNTHEMHKATITKPTCCTGELADSLWRKKKEDMSKRLLLNNNFFQQWASDDAGRSRLFEMCRKSGTLSPALFKKIVEFGSNQPKFRNDVADHFLRQTYKTFSAGTSPAQWELLCLMHCFAPSLNMPPRSFPAIEELSSALLSEDEEKVLMDRMTPFIPFFSALAALKKFSQYAKDYVTDIKIHRDEVSQSPLESLNDAAKVNTLLLNIQLLRRTFIKFLHSMRPMLTDAASDSTPVLSTCLGVTGMHFALTLQPHVQEICEELRQACQQNLPPEFDVTALRSLLDRIIPPLISHDRAQAEEEISALDERSITPKQSPLLAVILPAIQGEKEVDGDIIEEEFPDFPYSLGMVRKLEKKEYALATIPDEPLSEPKSTCQPQSGPEPEVQPKMTAPPLPEHEPEAVQQPESELQSQPESEPEQEVALQPQPKLGLLPQSEPETASTFKNSVPETKPAGTDGGSCKEVDSQMYAEDTEHYVSPKVIAPAHAKSAPAAQTGETIVLPEPDIFTKHTHYSAKFDTLLGSGALAETLKNKLQGKSSEAVHPSKPSSMEKATLSAESEATSDADSNNSDSQDILASSIKSVMDAPAGLPPVKDSTQPSDLFNELIMAQDSCALYWLASTLGENSILPLWLAELLHFGLHYQPCFVSLRPKIAELCNTAASNLQQLDEKQKLLLATAILRPALMMPEQAMATITTSLAPYFMEYNLRDLLDELGQFVRIGKPLEDAFVSVQSPKEHGRQEDLLKKETENLFQRIMSGKMRYQPATKLRKELFEKRGVIGKVLDACMRGIDNGLQNFIDNYQNERDIKTLIDRSQANASKHSIEAGARQKLIEEIVLAVDLAKRWQVFFRKATNRNEPSYEEQQLENLYAAMNKAKLQSCPEGEWFIRQMEGLHSGEMSASCSPMDALELWPLRLPCAYACEDAVFEPLSLAQALHIREFDEKTAVAASLAIHMAKGKLASSAEFLNTFSDYRDIAPAESVLETYEPALSAALPFTLDDVLTASRSQWQQAFDSELEKLKEYLGDSYFRGAILYDQQSKINVQSSDIVLRSSSTPDKAQGIQELKKLSEELQEWDESSLAAVRVRINELRAQASASAEVLNLLGEIEQDVCSSRIFSAAWDNIARLESYLAQQGELPTLHAKSTAACSTAQQFYKQLPDGIAESTVRDSNILWQRVCNLRNRRSTDSSFRGITTELLRWLGFTLSQTEQPAEVFSSGSPNFWRVLRYSMVLNSPLPQWGSGARGQHVIAFGWDVTPAAISNLLTSGYINATNALTVICCGSLSFSERKEMLRLAKSWPVFPLVIDRNLFNFLASTDEAARTEKMFETALAGSPYNPYTPDVAGAVPREMFFGRENDKVSVLSDKGTCIIYGGRQLGKSALLQQIYEEYNLADSDIKVIQYTMAVQDTSILDVTLKQCIKAGVVSSGTTRKTLKDNLLDWLRSGSGRRVLLLLDECDSILDEDFRNDFHDVWELRNMMQDSSRSFKVVFTGLHSVQRFSHKINNPLYHFGVPICIGPLSTDAAYGLMTKPMSLLGLEFETPQLVQMALNYCNYQPKLIQMFCSELVKGIGKLPSREPVHIIDKSTMLKVYDSQDLKTRIRDCFKMTLNLDERYLVVGYTMALLQAEDVSISRLQNELRSYWPAAFATGNSGDMNTLQSLLHEMEGLGLVISLGGSYRLRTPNITELLGGQEDVLLHLGQFYDRPYQPVADPDELRIEEADVLVASQFNLLADKSNRLCWISGSKALGLNRMPAVLQRIAKKTEINSLGKMRYAQLSGMSVLEAMKSLRGSYEKLPEGGLIVSISSDEFPQIPQFMKDAEKWLAQLRTDKKYVKIVCLVGPDCLYDLIREHISETLSSYQMPLQPWTENSVDYWCKAKTLPGLNAKNIMEKTGGWPCLTYPALTNGKDPSNSMLPGNFIPNVPELIQIVAALHELGGDACPEEEIANLIDMPESLTEADFQCCIDLLKSLHVLHEGHGGLRLDPIAAKVITGA